MHAIENLPLPADDPFLEEAAVARFMGEHVETTRRRRRSGDGPTYIRAGRRRIVYRRSDVLAWLVSRRFNSAAEEAALGQGAQRAEAA